MPAYVEGLPVLEEGSRHLHPWVLVNAPRTITLRDGAVGFILAFWADWFDENVERLDQPGEHPTGIDDGGYSHRAITGGSGWSKHATAGAEDLNWRKHVYNTFPIESFTTKQIAIIHAKLRDTWVGGVPVIEWGGDWPSHPGSTAKPDPMHFQISSHVAADPITACEVLAKRWMRRKRGAALLEVNPGQRAVILS